MPDQTQGSVAGHQALGITLDGAALKAGEEVSGTLTVTDVRSGSSYPVAIAARVTPAMEFHLQQEIRFFTGGGAGGEGPHEVHIRTNPVFNVPAGGVETKAYPLVNNAASAQKWTIESSDDLVSARIASGELAPGATVHVKLIARAAGRPPGCHESTLTLDAAGGAVRERYAIKTHVIPPYRPPAVPAGDAVYLNDLDGRRVRVKSHVNCGVARRRAPIRDVPRHRDPGPFYDRTRAGGENLNPKYGYKHDVKAWEKDPFTIGRKKFARGLWAHPRQETVYGIAGAGFAAFAAEVGFFDGLGRTNPNANTGAVVYFEIHVDGQLRAASGPVKLGDHPRPMVVVGLEKAREIKLLTRKDDGGNDPACLATWGDPRFIRR